MNLRQKAALVCIGAVVCTGIAPSTVSAAKGFEKLDELSADRWQLLRETEKYQLQIAEKYYREKNYPVAAAEYEKFLTLYESSEGAPYVQLMWSHCQVKTKKLNTAVKDGYQSVIDYWPDSPEAVAAAYLIGDTYRAMGETEKAKQAYQKVLEKHPDEMVATLTRLDLAEMARLEGDRARRVTLLRELVTGAPRTGDAARRIVAASEELARLEFEDAAFSQGLAALATSYKEPDLAQYVARHAGPAVAQQLAAAETKERALKLADTVIAYFDGLRPAAPKDDAERGRVKQLAYNAASIHRAAGRLKEAGDTYDSLIAEFPNDDDVLKNYAEYLFNQNRRDDARLVLGRMKNKIESQSLTASYYRREGKPLLAVPIYENLVAEDSKGSSVWQLNVGRSYQEAGKYKEAIGAYRQSNEMPTNLQYIAECQNALKEYREAIGTYTQIAAAYEPRAPWALLEIAYVQERAGDKETAIKTLQNVCRKYPSTGEAARAHQHLNNQYNITVTRGGGKDE